MAETVFIPSEDSVITKVDQTDPFNIYIGRTLTGRLDTDASWSIRLIVDTIDEIQILRANAGKYDQIWSNRTSLTYA